MSVVPPWLVGRNVTAISITGETAGSDGTLTPGSTITLTGHLDEITLDQVNDTENIVPLDVRQNNEVITGSGTSMSIVEILSAYGTTGNLLATVAESLDLAVFTYTRGGKAFTCTHVIKGYTEGIRRGKSVGTMSLGPAGVAPTYA